MRKHAPCTRRDHLVRPGCTNNDTTTKVLPNICSARPGRVVWHQLEANFLLRPVHSERTRASHPGSEMTAAPDLECGTWCRYLEVRHEAREAGEQRRVCRLLSSVFRLPSKVHLPWRGVVVVVAPHNLCPGPRSCRAQPTLGIAQASQSRLLMISRLADGDTVLASTNTSECSMSPPPGSIAVTLAGRRARLHDHTTTRPHGHCVPVPALTGLDPRLGARNVGGQRTCSLAGCWRHWQ